MISSEKKRRVQRRCERGDEGVAVGVSFETSTTLCGVSLVVLSMVVGEMASNPTSRSHNLTVR